MDIPYIYRNIKLLRLEKGWSQTELAKRVGYSDKSMIAKIENGKVDLPQSKIIEFAEVLGTTPTDLLGWTSSDDVVNEIANAVLYHDFDETEMEVIRAFRNADSLTQQMVLRLLKVGD